MIAVFNSKIEKIYYSLFRFNPRKKTPFKLDKKKNQNGYLLIFKKM